MFVSRDLGTEVRNRESTRLSRHRWRSQSPVQSSVSSFFVIMSFWSDKHYQILVGWSRSWRLTPVRQPFRISSINRPLGYAAVLDLQFRLVHLALLAARWCVQFCKGPFVITDKPRFIVPSMTKLLAIRQRFDKYSGFYQPSGHLLK